MAARGDDLESRELGGQHDVINGPLLGAETAAGREGAGDIAGITVQFTPGINQNQIAVTYLAGVFGVMQYAAIAARRNDR